MNSHQRTPFNSTPWARFWLEPSLAQGRRDSSLSPWAIFADPKWHQWRACGQMTDLNYPHNLSEEASKVMENSICREQIRSKKTGIIMYFLKTKQLINSSSPHPIFIHSNWLQYNPFFLQFVGLVSYIQFSWSCLRFLSQKHCSIHLFSKLQGHKRCSLGKLTLLPRESQGSQ